MEPEEPENLSLWKEGAAHTNQNLNKETVNIGKRNKKSWRCICSQGIVSTLSIGC